MIRIDIEHFDLDFEKHFEISEAFVELHDTYFRYVSKHDSEQPKDKNDLSMGWEALYNDWDIRVKRSAFVSVENTWDDKNDKWNIELEAFGYGYTIKLYFQKKDENKMYDVFNKIFDWIFIPEKNNTMIQIEKKPVTSSNIEAIGYDEETQTLRVWFKNGGAYDYDKVPKEEFEALQNASSVGSYFASNIKGKYAYKKV